MGCCSDFVDAGCFNYCSVIDTGYDATQTGVHTIEVSLGSDKWNTYSVEFTIGDDLTVVGTFVNEQGEHFLRIKQPDDSYYVFATGITCLNFTTQIHYGAGGTPPPDPALCYNDCEAIHDDIASEISAITEKLAPTTGDWLIIEDGADSNNKKRVNVGNLPTASGALNTASNGLNVVVADVQLGGTLTKITTINGVFPISFSSIDSFSITANGDSFRLGNVASAIWQADRELLLSTIGGNNGSFVSSGDLGLQAATLLQLNSTAGDYIIVTAPATDTSETSLLVRNTGTGAIELNPILDEDDMSSDSSTQVSSQQAIKAYVDAQIDVIQLSCSDLTTDLTTGTSKAYFRTAAAFTVNDVRASVLTAPTGATLTVDINEGGVSILSTKLTIDISEKTSTTAATPPVISDSSLADDAEITIDIDQIGSTVAGAGLIVTLIGKYT